MPVKVKKITLWRKELENRAGTLSDTLEPLAEAGADLQVVMGYCYPGERFRAAVEIADTGDVLSLLGWKTPTFTEHADHTQYRRAA